MADKFIIHGATFNGDGTSSAQATVDGGPGAWNNINILTGTAPTYGTLAAGDVVYIRSKTSAGADLTLSGGSFTLGLAAATIAAPVRWIFDNGLKWSGIDGLLTISQTEWQGVTLRPYNHLVSLTDHAFRIVLIGSNCNVHSLITQQGCYTKGLYIDANACTTTNSAANLEKLYISGGLHENIKIRASAVPATRGVIGTVFNQYSEGNAGVLVNPEIELTTTGTLNTGAIFRSMLSNVSACGSLTVIGGRTYGVGANEGYISLMRHDGHSGSLKVYGFDYPKIMPTLVMSAASAQASAAAECSVVGADFGYGSFFGSPTVGYFDSRNLLFNYPKLNAAAPDAAATPLSWRGVPSSTLRQYDPMVLKSGVLFIDTAAAKTVTMELLVSDTIASGTIKDDVIWMTVMYVDNATDNYVTETTRASVGAETTLATSTAGWDKTDWGTINTVKRKVSLTTAGSIKPNTMVVVSLFWALPALGANDMFFVCPEVVLS